MILFWRIWKGDLFPYRTAEYLGYDKETGELLLGPWEWHAPRWWQWLRRASRVPVPPS